MHQTSKELPCLVIKTFLFKHMLCLDPILRKSLGKPVPDFVLLLYLLRMHNTLAYIWLYAIPLLF